MPRAPVLPMQRKSLRWASGNYQTSTKLPRVKLRGQLERIWLFCAVAIPSTVLDLDWRNLDQYAVDCGIPRQRIQRQLVGDVITAHARMALRDGHAYARAVMSEAVRQADHAGHDLLAGFNDDLQRAHPRAHADLTACRNAPLLQVLQGASAACSDSCPSPVAGSCASRSCWSAHGGGRSVAAAGGGAARLLARWQRETRGARGPGLPAARACHSG